MKRIEWHNPANATPPEGYRLLIPEEVDGRFNSNDCPAVQMMWDTGEWSTRKEHIYCNDAATSYVVPQDTPLPEGYVVINGEPWQMNGWNLNVPANERVAHGYSPIAKVQVRYRNGNGCEAENFKHWFGPCPEKPEAEIIGWRIVEQKKAPEAKPMTATEILEQRYPKDRAADRAWAATQQMSQQLEDFRTVLAENQRLKNELADAQATLNEMEHRLKQAQATNEHLTKKLMEVESYAPKRIQSPNGTIYRWDCPEHLIPIQKITL